jgi:Caspase domain
MRRALAVGIDHYTEQRRLRGCVADANAIAALLERDDDGSPNFEVRRVTSGEGSPITRFDLLAHVEALFAHEADVVLLFFAGHGTENNLGGYLMTSEATRYNEGLAMGDVVALARESPAQQVIIILDCCQAGAFGNVPAVNNEAPLREGLSVLMAARATQVAAETGGRGLFSTLVCSALEGGAADTLGKVTVASVYAYVDEALGSWQQRPMLKAHVPRLVGVRQAQPSVAPGDLRELAAWFPTPDHDFPLDPSYEPTEEPRDEEHERVFGRMQKMRAAKLIEPVGDEDHMYYAAKNSGACRLTQLGQLYWRLVRDGRI